MINDAVDPHRRFFTDAACHIFRQKRTIPDKTLVFAARFTGRSLDSNGVDFTLIEPQSGDFLVRGHVYNLMMGHVVLQVLSWRPEPEHKEKMVQMSSRRTVREMTIQVGPIQKKSVNWPPPMSLSTVVGFAHYAHFRARFKNETGHQLLTLKAKSNQLS